MTEQATMEATPAPAGPAQAAREEARAAGTADGQGIQGIQGTGEALIADEMLVEEVSIDGMCGVY